jgi:hypothetical protein
MSAFPSEFSDLLSRRSDEILRDVVPLRTRLRSSRFLMLAQLLDPDRLRPIVRRLDRELFPLLRVVSSPIASDSIARMKENYSEHLNKTMHIRTAYLRDRRARSFDIGARLGLIQMMHSESLVAFAEAVTGLRLRRPCEVQVICYCDGDYAGPHNDHHPEDVGFRHGYVDFQITLTNPDVAHQYLVYERHGHLSEIVDVASCGGVSIYHLPFWHYVTPLVARQGRERTARRWLLLATFQILSLRRGKSTRHR